MSDDAREVAKEKSAEKNEKTKGKENAGRLTTRDEVRVPHYRRIGLPPSILPSLPSRPSSTGR